MRPVWLLLFVPFAAVAWVPFYNRETPSLFGFPFFYWYQLLWVPDYILPDISRLPDTGPEDAR